MRVLVTNDDGIMAPGLRAVVEALAEAGYDLVVAAPRSDRSGSGSGLGSIEHGEEIEFATQEFPGLPGLRAFIIDAPPSFAVLASCTGVLGPRPDLVVSGINDGFNTGRLILSSSTVGAAMTAASLGVSSLAISAGFPPGHRFDTAARVATASVRWLIEQAAPRTVLNVNVPDRDISELKGVRLAPLSPRGLLGLRVEQHGDRLRLHRFENSERLGSGTDSALVHEGYVAVSLLSAFSASEGQAHRDPARVLQDEVCGDGAAPLAVEDSSQIA